MKVIQVARLPLVRQAIEITEREIRDPIGHWGIGKHGLANRLGLDLSDDTFNELEAAAIARLAVLRGILGRGKGR